MGTEKREFNRATGTGL